MAVTTRSDGRNSIIMAAPRKIPDFIWRVIGWLNPRISSRFRKGRKASQLVLVLTTTGRNSGCPHKTPLQYELVEGIYYVASARGVRADWYRNLVIEPNVTVGIASKEFSAQAEAISDPVRIADFLELRLERNPKMIRTMMRIEGLPANFSRKELEEFASHKALAVLHRI
jgi:deazaflavin-dependent oxidoreductase (nitroreductase family)